MDDVYCLCPAVKSICNGLCGCLVYCVLVCVACVFAWVSLYVYVYVFVGMCRRLVAPEWQAEHSLHL